MVPVPDEADEDPRLRVRERTELIAERVGLTNRIRAVLATLGCERLQPIAPEPKAWSGRVTDWSRRAATSELAKIERLLAQLELVLAQIAELERERDAVVETEASDKASTMIQQLTTVRGIGVQNATVLVREAFIRHFANCKALGSYAGLASSLFSTVGSTASRASERQAIGGSEQ